MTATDKTLDLEGKEHLGGMVVTYQLCKNSEEHLERYGCNTPLVQVFRRTSRAVCTELAPYKRARPMRGKSHHGGTSCRTSDGRHV